MKQANGPFKSAAQSLPLLMQRNRLSLTLLPHVAVRFVYALCSLGLSSVPNCDCFSAALGCPGSTLRPVTIGRKLRFHCPECRQTLHGCNDILQSFVGQVSKTPEHFYKHNLISNISLPFITVIKLELSMADLSDAHSQAMN